jgi:glycosyltransferase involved in cell wall biosynthesis
MIYNMFLSLLRWAARCCHNRRVWIGDQCHALARDRSWGLFLSLTGFDLLLSWLNHQDTCAILQRFPEVEVTEDTQDNTRRSLIPDDLRAEWIAGFMDFVGQVQKQAPRAEPLPLAFTVVIPFYAHLQYLKACLASVDRATRHAPETPLEIIIVNDDPEVTDQSLKKAVPPGLRDKARLFRNPLNLGICASLNRAVAEARNPWILHLDCDDCLSADCIAVLKKRILRYPGVRYISSRMLDIDGDGRLLRVRVREEKPSELMLRGMVAGHLKVIRRDLFEAIGSYDETVAGCQDYEFSLRTSLFEPILFIPDYLYRYRWHGRTQSVAQAKRQAETTKKIRDSYLLAGRMLATHRSPRPLTFQGPASSQWAGRYLPDCREERGLVVEVHRPFNALTRRLLAVRVSRFCVEHEGRDMPSIPLVL